MSSEVVRIGKVIFLYLTVDISYSWAINCRLYWLNLLLWRCYCRWHTDWLVNNISNNDRICYYCIFKIDGDEEKLKYYGLCQHERPRHQFYQLLRLHLYVVSVTCHFWTSFYLDRRHRYWLFHYIWFEY